jgi:methionyl-tRNA formyltransferase
MKIIYFGNNTRGVKCLEALHESGLKASAVVIHHKAPDESGSHSVHHLAKKLCVPVFDPVNVNSSEFLDGLRKFAPDLMILSGYNQILKKEILTIPRKGTINLHGGRLPEYRGGSPINWQIINGETQGACSIIYVDEGIDTGDIIAQGLYDIGPYETAGEIADKTLKIFPELLIGALERIKSGKIVAIKQDHSAGKYYCKRYPQDGRIDWKTMTSLEIHNLSRALNGPQLPGSFSVLNGETVIIWKTKLSSIEVKGVPGRVALKAHGGVIVLAKDKGLVITEIKVGKNPEVMPANSYFKIRGWTFD